MRCARLLLDGGLARDADRAWVEAFFAPDAVDVDRIAAMTAGLRKSDRAVLTQSREDDSRAQVLMFRRGVVSRDVLAAHPELRLVQRLGEGSRSIDLAAAAERGVEVSCLHRPTLDAVAEHALLLVLALAKRLSEVERAGRLRGDGGRERIDGTQYNWAGVRGIRQLNGATLGVIGLGEIGSTVARLAHAFRMRVLFTTRTPQPEVDFATPCDLPSLLAEADFVTLHVPGDAGSPLIGSVELARMKAGSFFVNTARGNLVDEDALHHALVSGHLAGAALDVHAEEPRSVDDRFNLLENVILTPHVGSGSSRAGVLDELEAMFDNIRAVLRGSPPVHGRVTLG